MKLTRISPKVYRTTISGFTWEVDGTSGVWMLYYVNHKSALGLEELSYETKFSTLKDARYHLALAKAYLKITRKKRA